ncbi:hypothetical protein MPSEU_000079800 [Mayamaea pseudoterrestris]|nr:hypothetical protein MPSEU_000079800 [Mayamaea pseudoterrestris]
MPVESFEQLIGAAGDVKELEYISALHQTDCDELRRDCSIQADDIRLFLRSRYGIVVETETVHSVIMSGLGGGSGKASSKMNNGNEADDEVIDLMELVALLMIPTLLKARLQQLQDSLPEGVIKPPHGLLEYVLKIILHDTTGCSAFKPLDADLLKAILISYGEDDLASNEDLIEDMLAATNGATKLDTNAFADGLTGDVQLFDINNEARLTTLYEDVFVAKEETEISARRYKFGVAKSNDPESGGHEDGMKHNGDSPQQSFTRNWMAPSIDVTADLYRSKMLVVFLWSTIVISYFAYVWLGQRMRMGGGCECRGLYNYTYTGSYKENSDVIICELSVQVAKWILLFTILSIVGLTLVTVGSIGNYVGSPWWQPLIGGTLVLLFSVIPFASNISGPSMLNAADVDDDNALYVDECSTTSTTTDQPQLENQYLATMALVLGVITAAFHFAHVFSALMPKGCFRNAPLLTSLLSAGTKFGEMHTKQAGSYKLAQMTKNALDVMRVNDESTSTLNTHFAQGLGEFAKTSRKYRTVGGFVWTWKHLWNNTAYRNDGIWLSTRMISSNIAQWIVSMYVLFRGVKLTKRVASDYQDEVTKRKMLAWTSQMMDPSVEAALASTTSGTAISLMSQYLASETNLIALDCPTSSGAELFDEYCFKVGEQYECNLPNWPPVCALLVNTSDLSDAQAAALLDASGFDSQAIENATSVALQQATDQTFDQFYPAEQYMVTVPVAIAAAFAFMTAVYLSLAYIPSVCKTILMLRCGAIKTMRDPKFIQYRQAPDQVSILTGSLFWGAYFSSILVGAVLGLLVFFFLWQETLYFAQRAIALVVGFLVITLIRLILVCSCRCSMYKAFYRKRPALANFTLLALEWTNFALSAGFIFVRMIKLLLAAAASIGRIDRPFLAHGVGRVGPIELDNYPIVHTKDILSHEAHRHPYIELLGVIYMMKLRCGDDFGDRAGSTWRLLFVYALFPWLHQYRVKARPELLHALRPGLSEVGRASTMRLQYLSVRRIVDIDLYDELAVDDEGNESQPIEAAACAFRGEDSDEGLPKRASSLAVDSNEAPTNEESLGPGAFSSPGADNDEYIRQLEEEVTRLNKELKQAKQM